MAKRISLISVGILLIALLVTVTASGSDATQHHFTVKDRGAWISTSPDYPRPGSTAVQAGEITAKIGGHRRGGASRRVIKITSFGSTGGKFKGTGVFYFGNGSMKTKFHGTVTFQQGGGTTGTLKGQITGGTGTYRGATGNWTGNGSTSEPPSVGTIATTYAKGTISY